MKRFLLILVVLLLTASVVTLADAPRWMALDPAGSSVEVFGADLKPAGSFKVAPRPFSLKPLPDQNGYALLYLGSETILGSVKDPGGILYLDSNLKPGSKKIPFSGLVVSEYYQKDSNTWFVFTAKNPRAKNTENNLYIVQLQNGTVKTVSLTSSPSFFKIKDNTKMAVATTGNSEANIKPELFLIDINTLDYDKYPLTLNPGAIFFIDNDQLLVACGGYRDAQKNILSFVNGPSDTSASEQSILHLINSSTKTVKSIPVGYSPLAIVQDQSKPDLFYLGCNAEANPAQPSGFIQVLTGDTITSKLKLDAETTFLAKAATGNLCVLSHEQFFLIDPVNSKIINKLQYDLKIDALRFSRDGKTGYLTNVNSNYMDIINLSDGSRQARLQIGKLKALGSISLSKLLPSALPPVIGMQERLQRNPESVSTNHRMFLATDSDLMYVLSSNSEVKAFDLKTNTFKTSIEFPGKPYGMHPTPNSKFIVVPTPKFWNLIDPNQNKPILSIRFNSKTEESAPETGYYSPDGSLLIIPFENTLFVVDTATGKFLGKAKTKIKNPIIVWPR